MINSFVKLYVLIGVVCCIFKGVYCCIVVGEGYQEMFMVEFFFDVVKVVIFLIEYVFFVQFYVVKGDFIVVIYMQIEFFKFGYFDVWFVYINKLFGVDRFVWRSFVVCYYYDVRGVGVVGNKIFIIIKINFIIFTGISCFQVIYVGVCVWFGNC